MHDGPFLSESIRSEQHFIAAQHSVMVAQITDRVRESRFLMHESWRALAVSRRRVLRRPPIAGGAADGHEEQLRGSIRGRLVGRALPLIDNRAWAGKAAGGNRCVCCGEPIARADCEYEPQAHAGLYAHAPCYGLWVAESAGLRGRDLVDVN